MEKVLSLLPDRFDGVLLDVPVGTGVFTAPFYRRYPEATIIGVDCSMNMLRQAQARFQEQGVHNVHLLKADAAHLPVRDATVDLVLSMNGWHAFADKQRPRTDRRSCRGRSADRLRLRSRRPLALRLVRQAFRRSQRLLHAAVLCSG